MSIRTIFAHLSCSDLAASTAWYEKLFEDKKNAGHSTLTLGVLPIEPERERLIAAGLSPGPIESAKDFFILRMRDPDQNLIVLASASRR